MATINPKSNFRIFLTLLSSVVILLMIVSQTIFILCMFLDIVVSASYTFITGTSMIPYQGWVPALGLMGAILGWASLWVQSLCLTKEYKRAVFEMYVKQKHQTGKVHSNLTMGVNSPVVVIYLASFGFSFLYSLGLGAFGMLLVLSPYVGIGVLWLAEHHYRNRMINYVSSIPTELSNEN